MSITLPRESVVHARYFESWSMSLFGRPKMTVICGGCSRQFKTRDYMPFNQGKSDEGIVANCPICGKWNILKGIRFE